MKAVTKKIEIAYDELPEEYLKNEFPEIYESYKRRKEIAADLLLYVRN
ncbi:hypothetical protein [Acidianus sp. HS-5]|nr:hypothetical protein [Acidianus sp. HS-5]BDC19537.1 hypothetical protein HS5_24270 [Acidianus sp. HS-5]